MKLRLMSIIAMAGLLLGSARPLVTHADHTLPGPGGFETHGAQALAECDVLKSFADGSALYHCPPPEMADVVAVAAGRPTRVPPTPSQMPQPTMTHITPPPTSTPQMPQPTATSGAPSPTSTQAAATPVPTTGAGGAPFPSAPACAAHDNHTFHTLWNSTQGCHYDHEHGQNPFTPEVAAAFPGFDLRALLGNVEIGHTNPSSEMENTHKHGGFKWDVTLSHSDGCAGREGVPTGVDALAVQYHAFGDYSIEFESRIHSAVGMLRQCQAGNPADKGYIFVNQHQDYGQRTTPYQGIIMPYPDTPLPAYDAAREPYLAVECYGGASKPCNRNPSLAAILSKNRDVSSTWISEPQHIANSGSPLFGLLFRLRDSYQALLATDMVYPFTFRWLCSQDAGKTYAALAGCRYNNTTTRVHEVMGEIPQAWDNLAGFDTDPRLGRITAAGYVTRFGVLAPACAAPGPNCHPIKLIQAFTGRYGSGFDLTLENTLAFDPRNLPERDIYFCGGKLCGEFDLGAVAAGWVGPMN